MHKRLVPFAAALALSASPALASDIVSCSSDNGPPMMHGPGGPGMPNSGDTPPAPGGNSNPGQPPHAPGGTGSAITPGGGPSGGPPHEGPPTMQGSGGMPGGPSGMMMIPAPTVDTPLHCEGTVGKMDGTLASLTSKGWRLQGSVAIHGNVTFYMTK